MPTKRAVEQMEGNAQKPLRIALVVPAIHNVGGIERMGSELANWLSDRGQSILILTTSPSRRNQGPSTPLRPGITIDFFHHDRDLQGIRDSLLSFDADCCVALYCSAPVTLWPRVLLGTGIPFLYSEHSNPQIIEEKLWNRDDRQAVLAAADQIHLLMEQFIESVPESDRHKAQIVPNFSRYPVTPVDRSGREEKVLLSLGRLEERSKQLHLLIEAFALIAPELPEWRLELWGEGPDRKRIQKMIDQKQLQERVMLMGLAKNPEEQFRQADLFCIPSKYEGFSNTVIEAMAHGLPVIGYAGCPGLGTIAQHEISGLMAQEMNAESLAEQLKKAMSERELRERLSKGALRRTADFEKERVMLQWEEMIQKCSEHKGNTALERAIAPLNDPENRTANLLLLWNMSAPFQEWRRYNRVPIMRMLYSTQNFAPMRPIWAIAYAVRNLWRRFKKRRSSQNA